MLKRLSNTQLLLVLLTLAGTMAGIKCWDTHQESTGYQPRPFVVNDKEKVDKITVLPATDSIEPFTLRKYTEEMTLRTKEGTFEKLPIGWVVYNDQSKVSPVKDNWPEIYINQMEDIVRLRSVTGDPQDHQSLGVDDSGSDIILLNGEDTLFHVIFGHHNRQGEDNIETYVREASNDTVYTVPGTMENFYDMGVGYWIDSTQLFNPLKHWDQIELTLPAFSSYKMVRNNNGWFLDGEPVNEERLGNYLGSLDNFRLADNAVYYDHADSPFDFQVLLTSTADTFGIRGYTEIGDQQQLIYFLSISGEIDRFPSNQESFDHLFIGKSYFIED